MYLQIADDLRKQIESGKLDKGDQLPTEGELSEKYTASRNTVRDAIKHLTAMHLVEPKPGKGTFVTKTIEPFVTDLSPQTGDGGEEGQTYPAQVKKQDRKGVAGPLSVSSTTEYPADIADLLGITSDTEVIIRKQARFIDDDLWSDQTSYYPRKWADQGATRLLTATNIAEGTLRYLESALGLKQARYKDWITARPAKDNEPTRFDVPHNTAMFLFYRTGFTADGTAIRVTVTLYPADRNQFIYTYDNLSALPAEEDDAQKDVLSDSRLPGQAGAGPRAASSVT
jgi:GntR family transcriptional regulator